MSLAEHRRWRRDERADARPAEAWAGDGVGAAGPIGLVLVAAGLLGLVAGSSTTGASLSPLVWYLARAAGFTLYLLLWFSVVSGLGLTTKLLDLLGGRGAVFQIHRFTTELAFVLLALHLGTLALDPTVPLGLTGVLVPFMSDVRQPWTDLGILAAWGFVGVTLSFALRRWVGQRGWRLLHYAAFPLWLMGLAHGIGAGSDSSRPWAIIVYLATTAVVAFLALYRLLRAGRRGLPPVAPPRREHRPAVANKDAGTIGLVDTVKSEVSR